MARDTYIFREKRKYASWVASQTLEDYALRYTAQKARRFSAGRVANTAIGATAFLACEAIGAAITLAYGFSNAVAAIAAGVAVMFFIGLPIAYYAAKENLDIDLLTRGAGFGYLGSTITSLVYASFTFLLFAVEASIMAVALEALLYIPLSLAYILSSIVVIPIALYGMQTITRFQAWTQPIWIVLQMAPIIYLLIYGSPTLDAWQSYVGGGTGGVNLIAFGMAFSTLLSLLPQIGEQADYLRFLPKPEKVGRRKWWLSMMIGGPGWTLIGGAKLLLGSVLAVHVLGAGLGPEAAASPTQMFRTIFSDIAGDGRLALALTGLFIIVCQLKINVTNAYAGSIAWSNFFSRLTHAHPGRVIWLVFNVGIALLLMLVGILDMVESILIVYAGIAAGWIGALAGDLMISKPLRLSPKGIEFKRAHLFDINPVGCGALALSIIASFSSYFGLFGHVFQAFAPALGLVTAFVAAPTLALITHGRYYIARTSSVKDQGADITCVICENAFEPCDMAHCPVYAAPICSLCCTLEARCFDKCKTDSSISQQLGTPLKTWLPAPVFAALTSQFASVFGLMAIFTAINAAALLLIYATYKRAQPEAIAAVTPILWTVFFVFCALSIIASWGIALAHQSRRAAEIETDHHMTNLIAEIAAHDATDAQLQKAKDVAESANAAKSRYLVSVSHEIRAPLNSIYGYAQLLERGNDVKPKDAAKVIRRSSEHLSNLVEGLLDISSVENSIMRLSRDTVRLPTFLEQIVTMFHPDAAAKGLNFVYNPPERLPEFVRTDQKRLRQILINLLSNAIKFTDAGTVTLRVHYRNEIATFDIIDTGPGIAERDKEKILEPFERGTNAQNHSKHGIGIGLAITNTLIKIMGGDLQIESTLGQGTRFQVRLMLAQPQTVDMAQARPDLVTGYEGPKRIVLLVDDDPSQIDLLTRLLRPLGFDIHSAITATQGLKLASTLKPDLCLLDITLPDSTGWDLAQALRCELSGPFKIIMISADAHQYDSGGDGRAAHDRFLVKPVEMGLLVDTVGEVLDLTWITQSQESETQPSAPPAPWTDAQLALLDDIADYAQIGQVRALEESVQSLADSSDHGKDVAGQLSLALERFDFKAVATLAAGLKAMEEQRIDDV